MGSAHHGLDPRSDLVLDTHELGRRPGISRHVQTTASAPTGLGLDVIGVPPESEIELDVRLESVVEGVLVTGTAVVQLRGECVLCLGDVSRELTVDLQELYVYPGSEAEEDEASRLQNDLVDLEPILRDQVVLDLPFRPLCRDDCEGLCATCGANLNDNPDHGHDAPVDPRWAALADLAGDGDQQDRSTDS
ncbi:YceD family protein [Microlunatus speluncae]|uniref:YceD family protein n=1 Tax=Microlunatus speluncae TaxID=2594267 RepID=UPI0012663319|nr:DUF177 domain-containing protein [Microlunatus speluncae]